MRIPFILFCLLAAYAESASAESRITYYRDGTLLRQDIQAVKGVITAPLAAGMREGSLTVTPAPGTHILNVALIPSASENSRGKEIETLTEQRRRLEDRLQALESREAIFTAAAKSQSGKAPRKTKTNPDPLQAIRQGTDFAIAQLEAVYTARRKTNQEIQKLDVRLAASRTGSHPASEKSVQISVTPLRGGVTLRYVTSQQAWEPRYNLHLNGDSRAELQLFAQFTADRPKTPYFIATGSLTERIDAPTVTGSSANVPLALYQLPVTEEHFSSGIINHFSGTLTNSSTSYLPPGDTGLYRKGTYVGKFRFEGLSSGRSRALSLGR